MPGLEGVPRPPGMARQAPPGPAKGQHKKSEGTPPRARRAARRPIEQARGRLHGLTLPVGPSYGEATQRRIKRTTKDHIHIDKMPYAAGYEGFSAASKQKRTRIICTLGPASWCGAASKPATAARARNHARACGAAPATAPAERARTHAHTRTAHARHPVSYTHLTLPTICSV